MTQIEEPRLIILDSGRSPQQKQEAEQRRKVLTELSEAQRQRRKLQLENYTNAEINELLKVAQHKSLRQVQQEALTPLGDDKESVGDTGFEGLSKLRNTLEQCLKTFKNTVVLAQQASTSYSKWKKSSLEAEVNAFEQLGTAQ